MDWIESIPTMNITKQSMNNTKLYRILATKDINASQDEFDLDMKGNIVNTVNVWTDENITLTNNDITHYDMAVLDTIYTIMKHGYTLFTPESVVHIMSGNSRVQITPKRINEVMESISKLQLIRIKVDCTSEFNAYQKKRGMEKADSMVYESYLLPVGKAEARFDVNGKKVIAYRILELPALYRYAEMNGQIAVVPAHLFDTLGVFADTEEAILIKRYVIKRVAQIVKKNKLNNNKISFIWFDKSEKEQRGLFPDLGYVPEKTPAWRKKKARINEVVKGTLDVLVEGMAITGYEEYREDGTKNPASPVIGYMIKFDRKRTSLPT